MQRCFGLFCVSLVLCATLSETIGLVIAAKEKRGWTLNSAGYLLGPRRIDHLIQIKDGSARGRDEMGAQYGIDGHRSLGDKSGLAGKREMPQDEEFRTDGIDGHRSLGDKSGLAGKREMPQDEEFRTGALRIPDEDIVHTIIDFLSYLKLKEIGAFENLPSSLTSEELAER
ncbi:unnamed protein product [Arctogadus glacialis]